MAQRRLQQQRMGGRTWGGNAYRDIEGMALMKKHLSVTGRSNAGESVRGFGSTAGHVTHRPNAGKSILEIVSIPLAE
ncbi:hypothetical protein DPMN_058889 [Dreissena polymorpha]|uniref:Uncharacterized protein n=1 Tax=Dreissena polymorpha TaxID=45954 RepID=A0A9D4C2V1_DREPO|nr:hypothetical protein DPMN_058889 [Dreissena polymorpha]